MTNFIARAKYIPILREKMKKIYEKAIYTYKNNGYQKNLVNSDTKLNQEQRDKNMEEAKDRLRKLALLFDIKLNKKVGYNKIIKYLEPQFK